MRCASRSIIGIRPYRRSKVCAEDFLRTLKGVYSFEIWHKEEKAKIFLCSSEPLQELRKKVASFYPSAEVYLPEKFFVVDDLIKCEKRMQFCIAKAELKKAYAMPLHTEFDVDPFNTLLTAMIGLKAIYQVVFTPAAQKWMESAAKAAEGLMKGRVVGLLDPRIKPPSAAEKELAKKMMSRAALPAFAAEIRIAVFSENTEGYIRNFESFFRLFNNTLSGQGFKLKIPLDQMGELEKMRSRCLSIPRLRRKVVLSLEELAALAHLPGEDVHVREVEWVYTA
ncbi:hypothetical protein DRP05_02790 [Archaeoglobales archaeon]|nr:MAG: hypothetical protein DRP05_02790 [Archaeoglobales archaeon]